MAIININPFISFEEQRIIPCSALFLHSSLWWFHGGQVKFVGFNVLFAYTQIEWNNPIWLYHNHILENIIYSLYKVRMSMNFLCFRKQPWIRRPILPPLRKNPNRRHDGRVRMPHGRCLKSPSSEITSDISRPQQTKRGAVKHQQCWWG